MKLNEVLEDISNVKDENLFFLFFEDISLFLEFLRFLL